MDSSDKKFTRRQFIKGVTVATALPLLADKLPFYGSLAHAAEEADLVIAKNGSASQLLQAAMAPLGGMGRFVKKGQRVVIKANIAWARTPDQACTNNPDLMSALIKMCYDTGAKRVAVWDHTCDNYQFCFSRSGLKETAQKAGADIFSGHGRNSYKQVEVQKGKKLRPRGEATRSTPSELSTVMALLGRAKEFQLGYGVFWHDFAAASLTKNVVSGLLAEGAVWQSGDAVAVIRAGGEGEGNWEEVCYLGGPVSDSIKLVRALVGRDRNAGERFVFVPHGSPLIHALRKEGYGRNFSMILFERKAANG